MLIICPSCEAKARVKDEMAGKRGKCPKCGHIFVITGPAEEAPPPVDEGIVASGPGGEPPPIPPPSRVEESEPDDQPPSRHDDEDRPSRHDDEDRPSRRDDDDRPSRRDDEDDYEDERRSRRRSRDDEEEDDDDEYPRLRKRRQETGLSMASMIVGIVSASLGLFAICCWIVLAPLAGLGGVAAVILGFMGKPRGAEAQAITGIILGFVAIALSILWIFCGAFGTMINLTGGRFG
jgi:predicted Zn finger-like uncharacterized protein